MATTASELFKNTEIQPQMMFNFDDFSFPFTSNHVELNQFSETIKLFLQECAEIADYKVSGMPIWSTSLIKEDNREVFPLYTVEESVQNSLNPFCVHCQSAGWGHHFVSKRKYHLIIPARDRWDAKLEGKFSEIRSHILYGLIHSNGYGHLLCINGLREENDFFSGCETDVMNFWDRICSVLNTRKISIIDSFKKGSMDLRLLHVLAFGQTRFGRWGYMFGARSSGVTEEDIQAATKYLSSVTLERMIDRLKNKSQRKKLNMIICKYRKMSKTPLMTIGDFLKFLLRFKCRINPTLNETSYGLIGEDTYEYDSKSTENSGPIKLTSLAALLARRCRWPARRIEYVLLVIVHELEKNKAINGDGNLGISRHTLREETRKCVGDTGLIDFVLKSITSFKTGNHVIRRSINTSTRKFEFKIQELEPEGVVIPPSMNSSDCTWPDYVLKLISNSMIGSHGFSPSLEIDDAGDTVIDEDVLFLYRTLLYGYQKSDRMRSAIGVLMYSKHFEKEYWIIKEQDLIDQSMTLICKVLPSFDELENELTRPLSPGVVVKVQPSITIGELKVIVQLALRDTYCIMNKFVVNQIGGLKAIEDGKVLSTTLKHGDLVWIRGYGLDFDTKLRYEGVGGPQDFECVGLQF